MLAELAEAKGFSIEQLTRFGVRQGSDGVEIPYYDASGTEMPRVRVRKALEGKERFKWANGSESIVPYGLQRPIPWSRGYAFIVEGESDCWALWTGNQPALGVPGTSNTRCLQLEHVSDAKNLYVVREPGEAGGRFPHQVATKLFDLGFAGTITSIAFGDAKDPHELWRRAPEELDAHLREAIRAGERVARPEPVAAKPRASSLSAMLARPNRKAIDYLIEGLLGTSGVAMFAAKPKAGKSVLARNAALCVARGVPFLGRDTKAGTVLWARFEEPYNEFLADLEAMGAGDVGDRFFSNEETLPVEERMKWLVATALEMRPSLLVIDTLGKALGIEDLDKYGKVSNALEPLMQLAREHGIAQIWVHHSKKGVSTGGDHVLGSTSLFGACDTLVTLDRNERDVRTISTTQRYGEDLPPSTLTMDLATRAVTLTDDRSEIRRSQIETKIVELLATTPSLTRPEIVEAVDFRKSDVLEAMTALEERGLIGASGTGVKNDPFVFNVVTRNRLGTNIGNGKGTTSIRFIDRGSDDGSADASDSGSDTGSKPVPSLFPEQHPLSYTAESDSVGSRERLLYQQTVNDSLARTAETTTATATVSPTAVGGIDNARRQTPDDNRVTPIGGAA